MNNEVDIPKLSIDGINMNKDMTTFTYTYSLQSTNTNAILDSLLDADGLAEYIKSQSSYVKWVHHSELFEQRERNESIWIKQVTERKEKEEKEL